MGRAGSRGLQLTCDASLELRPAVSHAGQLERPWSPLKESANSESAEAGARAVRHLIGERAGAPGVFLWGFL